MGLKFILKGDAWHMHCFFAFMIFTDDETEAQDYIVTREKLTITFKKVARRHVLSFMTFFIFHTSPDITLWYRKLQHTF
jgi:hypothetical protein